METDNPAHGNVIYILAIMLERKKVLVEKDVHVESDATRRVYEHRKTGETFIVRDPHLRLDQLEHVQEDVVAMLEQGAAGTDAPEAPDDNPPAATHNA
jgi:hypothetical protein